MDNISQNVYSMLNGLNIKYKILTSKTHLTEIKIEPNFIIIIRNDRELSMTTYGAENSRLRITSLIVNGFLMEGTYDSIYKKVDDLKELKKYIEFGLRVKDEQEDIVLVDNGY